MHEAGETPCFPCVICDVRPAVELIVGERDAGGICGTCRDNIARACDHFGGYVGAWRIIPIVSIPPEVLEQARAG